MSNLWEETIEFLKENDKTFEDVLYIQGEDFKVTKENFEIVAKKTDYDAGFGAQHVPKDLVLVGEDWWIERYEYDGAEWWDFKSIPARKQYMKNITNLHKGMWDTLKEMNEE
nr:MAG TPA: hypothetical protein [Caudoviricetes sp.]